MNWGKAIIVALMAFIAFVGTLSYRMMTTQVDLVRPDYYQDEQQFQQQLQRQANGRAVGTAFGVSRQQNTLLCRLPAGLTAGQIQLFRPSDATQDRLITLQPGQTECRIPLQGLTPGRWRVKANWQAGGKEFYRESLLTL